MKTFRPHCFALAILFLSFVLTQAEYTQLKNISNVTIADSTFPVTRSSFGSGVNIMGDYNGDNISDIVIASKTVVTVIFGNSSLSTFDFNATTTPFEFVEFHLADIYPTALTGLSLTIQDSGDINGDGIEDLVIAPTLSPAINPLSGLILYGGPEFGKTPVNADNITSDQGVHIIYQSSSTGLCFSAGKDVNKDGFDDIVVGCTSDYNVLVVFGSKSLPTQLDLSKSLPANALTINNTVLGVTAYHFGIGVSWAGDMDGDGIEDIMISNLNDSPFDRTTAGTVILLYGHLSGNTYTIGTNTSNPSGFDGLYIYGDEMNDHLGTSYASVGDVNKDGLDDMLIGTSTSAFIIYGNKEKPYAGIDLGNATQATGAFTKLTGPSFGSGIAVSPAGDYNADGINDMVIGDNKGENCTSSSIYCGAAYIIFGQEGKIPNIDLLNVSSTQGIALHNSASGDQLGISVSGAGDVDGNGSPDVIIGSPGSNRVYLLLTGVKKEDSSSELWKIILGVSLGVLVIAFIAYWCVRRAQAHKLMEQTRDLRASVLEDEEE